MCLCTNLYTYAYTYIGEGGAAACGGLCGGGGVWQSGWVIWRPHAHSWRGLTQKRPMNTLKRLVDVQKRPMDTQKRPMNTQKGTDVQSERMLFGDLMLSQSWRGPTQMRPMITQKRSVNVQKRPTNTQKRPMNTQKRPINTQKRTHVQHKRKLFGDIMLIPENVPHTRDLWTH